MLSTITRNNLLVSQILVVVVFATCWLPISVYHLRRDFEDLNGPTSHNIFLFLLLHWTAMSSTVIDGGRMISPGSLSEVAHVFLVSWRCVRHLERRSG